MCFGGMDGLIVIVFGGGGVADVVGLDDDNELFLDLRCF